MDILKLLVFSISSVVYLFIVSKLMGKKAIAQLDFIDFTLSISVGSIASELATDLDDKPFYYYLISMAVFVFFHLAISLLERKGEWLKRLLRGRPLLVIRDGQIDYKNLKKSRLGVDSLIAMCREKGYFDLSSIAYAIFECSGTLSILPAESKRAATAEDLCLTSKKVTLPLYPIVDGSISKHVLNQLKKDRSWLMDRLSISSDAQLKNITLATYDVEGDEFCIHKK